MRISANSRGGFTISARGRADIEVNPGRQAPATKKAHKLAKGTADEVLAKLNATKPMFVVVK